MTTPLGATNTTPTSPLYHTDDATIVRFIVLTTGLLLCIIIAVALAVAIPYYFGPRRRANALHQRNWLIRLLQRRAVEPRPAPADVVEQIQHEALAMALPLPHSSPALPPPPPPSLSGTS